MDYWGIYFNLIYEKGKLGICFIIDKFFRFNFVVLLFKVGKISFFFEMQNIKVLGLFMEQIFLVMKDGIKGKDDCFDMILMFFLMNVWILNLEELKEQV